VCGHATITAQATIKYKKEEYFPLRFVLTSRFRVREVPFISDAFITFLTPYSWCRKRFPLKTSFRYYEVPFKRFHCVSLFFAIDMNWIYLLILFVYCYYHYIYYYNYYFQNT